MVVMDVNQARDKALSGAAIGSGASIRCLEGRSILKLIFWTNLPSGAARVARSRVQRGGLPLSEPLNHCQLSAAPVWSGPKCEP